AVDGGGRRIKERDFLVLAPVEQMPRVRVIVLHHVATVRLPRVGAGALVEDRLHRALEPFQAREKLCLVHVVGDLAAGEVLELVGLREVVDRDDLRDAAPVEALDEPRADEAGGTGDDVVRHLGNTSSWLATAVPSLPTTIPAARLAIFTAASILAPAASMTASVAITVS